MKRARKHKPGPKPSITLAVVKRVSKRVAMGLTLKLALAAESNAKINEETWKKALAAHDQFSPHYEAAKGKFLELAMLRLAKTKELKFLCWLLERRHPELFCKPDAAAVSVSVSQSTNVGIPSDVIERAQELAAAEDPRSKIQDPAPCEGPPLEPDPRKENANHGSH